jgi:hypothetical protein
LREFSLSQRFDVFIVFVWVEGGVCFRWDRGLISGSVPLERHVEVVDVVEMKIE